MRNTHHCECDTYCSYPVLHQIFALGHRKISDTLQCAISYRRITESSNFSLAVTKQPSSNGSVSNGTDLPIYCGFIYCGFIYSSMSEATHSDVRLISSITLVVPSINNRSGHSLARPNISWRQSARSWMLSSKTLVCCAAYSDHIHILKS